MIAETIGNPGLEVLDIPPVAEIAHAAGIPLLIDNTFATPYLSRPIALGADIVMHSITKWIGGHGIAIGGAIVDGGRFDWQASGKFPTLTKPYAGYHGIVFAEEFGPVGLHHAGAGRRLARFRRVPVAHQRVSSAAGRGDIALAHGTPHAKIPRRCLRFLRENPAVDWVLHPSLETHPDYALAQKLLPKGAGSIVSFGIKGGRAAGRKFIEAVRLASHLANVGDAKTLVIHPASTTHQQMDAAALAAAGVGEELIRISVGLEAASDIIDDFAQALRASQKA